MLEIYKAEVQSPADFTYGIKAANKACTRPPEKHRDYSSGSLRVLGQFAWLKVGSGKIALSHPAHPRVTPTVGQRYQF